MRFGRPTIASAVAVLGLSVTGAAVIVDALARRNRQARA